MKKYFKILAILAMTPIIQAEYKITINVDKSVINFKEGVEWITGEPSYTEWADVGYGSCSKWIPASTTELSGFQLTQNANCDKNQERYKQLTQKDKNSNLTQNVGDPILEKQTISGVKNSRTITATGYIQNGTGVKTCAEYGFNNGYGYWIQYPDGTSGGMYYGATAGQESYPTPAIETLSTVVKGYIISRGTYHQTDGSYIYYKVCKQRV